jgi:glycosyltransferase involved in cell wall biosynthesis
VTGDGSPPLSILFVIPTLPPKGGGAEVHALRLATALRARGHGVRLLTIAGEESAAGVPARPRRPFSLWVAATLLRDWGRHDVVQFFLAGRHTALGVPAAWLTGCPRVVMYGGSGTFADLEASREGRLALAIDLRLADRLVALNPGMRASFRALGVAGERIVDLPCEVDPQLFRPGDPSEVAAARARFGLPGGARVVTSVGRFVPEKELATLVAAFERVASADPAAILVLAGDGPERAAIVDRVGRLPDPKRVVMTGALAESEVSALLRASDVFALVSSLEGIPCALVEAMAAGLPCVVSDIDGTLESVTDGLNGVRIPLADVARLGDALLGLLSDARRRALMGAESRRRVLERYTPDIVAAAHERLYRELAGQTPRRR